MTEQTAPRGLGPSSRRPWSLWRRLGRLSSALTRWPVIAVLFLAAMLLGWIGFDGNMAALHEHGTFLDKLYRSAQLFVLHSGDVPPPVPWQLEVARFLAPAVDAFATLSAAAALLGNQASGMRVHLYSDHVVVCGLGRLGSLVAKTLRRAGHDVVAIESDPQNGAIGQCRDEGVIVFVGDATDRRLLKRAMVTRARYLFAVTGDDASNLKLAIGASKLVIGRHQAPLTCFVHVVDDKLAGVLRQVGAAQNNESVRLEYFNTAERGAPALLRERPAFDNEGKTALGSPHMLVVGLGEMGSNLVLHAARRWKSIPSVRGKRFKVAVVDRKADVHVAALKERFPRLKSVCDITGYSIELDSAEFERAGFLFRPDGGCDVTSVYVCLGDDALGLSAALHLRHRLGGRQVPIVVRTTQESGVASILAGRDGGQTSGGLEVFGLLDLVCKPDVLLGGQNEVLAQAIHGRYVRCAYGKGETPESNPSMLEWDLLPESLRESNRDQAADIRRKLRAVGCDIEPLTDWDAPPPEWSATELELLARMEHDRWAMERRGGGWKVGPKKNEVRKQTPYLVPYDELPDEIRESDRASVRGIPTFLAEVDFSVVRVRSGAG